MRARRILGALALAGALSLAGAQGAAAAPSEPSEFQIYSASGTVTLTCDPVGGTHPLAEKACADIEAAGGDIAAIPWLPGYGCVDEWDPVLIGVTGTWRGKEVLYSSFQSNRCYGKIRHGHVFFY